LEKPDWLVKRTDPAGARMRGCGHLKLAFGNVQPVGLGPPINEGNPKAGFTEVRIGGERQGSEGGSSFIWFRLIPDREPWLIDVRKIPPTGYHGEASKLNRQSGGKTGSVDDP
jgi:hypothetical protein